MQIYIFFNQVSNKNSPRTNQKGKTKKKKYQLKLANEDGNTKLIKLKIIFNLLFVSKVAFNRIQEEKQKLREQVVLLNKRQKSLEKNIDEELKKAKANAGKNNKSI